MFPTVAFRLAYDALKRGGGTGRRGVRASPAPSLAPMLSLAGMPDLRVYGSLPTELA